MKAENLDQERELLEGLAGNDKTAVEKIYSSNYKAIQSFIVRNNGTIDDARDIFQEGMVVLYEKSLDPAFELTCQIRTYLYSICRRLWLKRLQQEQRYTTQVEAIEELVSVDEDIEAKEKLDLDFARMESAMRMLGEPCKSLLEAFYINRKTMTDIADEFGYTNADNAKNQKYKCLIRLKKIFFTQHNLSA